MSDPTSTDQLTALKLIPDAMRMYSGAQSRARAAAKIHLIADHLALWGYSDLYALAKVLGCKADSAANSVRNYIKCGLLQRHHMSHCPAAMIMGTPALAYYVSAEFNAAFDREPLLIHPSRVNPTTYIHNLLAQRSAIFIATHVGEPVREVVPERLLSIWMAKNNVYRQPKEWLRMKIPDSLLVTESARRIAIETEEHEKDPDERERILYVYSQLMEMGIIDQVWYASTRPNVLKLYRDTNSSVTLRRWIYSNTKQKWRIDTVPGSDGKIHEMWTRPDSIVKRFRYSNMEALVGNYYPFVKKIKKT